MKIPEDPNRGGLFVDENPEIAREMAYSHAKLLSEKKRFVYGVVEVLVIDSNFGVYLGYIVGKKSPAVKN